MDATQASDAEDILYVHSIAHAGRVLPSSSRWNSIEIDFNLFAHSPNTWGYESLPSRFSKSVDFKLTVTNKKNFKRFICASSAIVSVVVILCLLLHFLPNKQRHHVPEKDLTLALKQALVFFDAQKSGVLPKEKMVMFRGDSGLEDGNKSLVGGFYDSGNNIKFSFTTAYTISLLSWSVIEYHPKYEEIGELHHIKDIIKWGTDYLLKLFIPPNQSSSSGSITLFSQVGGIGNNKTENDENCWQRPEDMRYKRPVSTSDETASDLAGEIIAALSAASLVFKEDNKYSTELTKTATELFDFVTKEEPGFVQGMYTSKDECGGEARGFYNSTGYKDELVWGGTWLFFATGNTSYLRYATQNLGFAEEEEEVTLDKGIFYWNNKFAATTVLLTRLRFFNDLGYPYEESFIHSMTSVESLMCSYLSPTAHKTQGGLIFLKHDQYAPLEYAATASFLSKLYSDYLAALSISSSGCIGSSFSVETLQHFSISQVNYILGDNPLQMSYVVGFGNNYPKHVHHRAASIPWDNQWHSCEEGSTRFNSQKSNPNQVSGAMVRGPDQRDIFEDKRDKPWFTEPTISSNAGLVAALVALHDPPHLSSSLNNSEGDLLGIDTLGIFDNVHLH